MRALWDHRLVVLVVAAFVTLAAAPAASGSSVVSRHSDRIDIELVTLFGSSSFSSCDLSFVARVDGNGRMWIDDIAIVGPNPCGDVRPCQVDGTGTSLPWIGQIAHRGEGGYRVGLSACIDTCIGVFRGRLPMFLESDRLGRWRAEFSHAPLGASGLQLDGRLRLDPQDGFHLREK
jgi:hypothetical protein